MISCMICCICDAENVLNTFKFSITNFDGGISSLNVHFNKSYLQKKFKNVKRCVQFEVFSLHNADFLPWPTHYLSNDHGAPYSESA